jgi:hypothetical protein
MRKQARLLRMRKQARLLRRGLFAYDPQMGESSYVTLPHCYSLFPPRRGQIHEAYVGPLSSLGGYPLMCYFSSPLGQ